MPVADVLRLHGGRASAQRLRPWVSRHRLAAAVHQRSGAASGEAANPFESGLRGTLLEAGVPMVPQLADRDPPLAVRVDLADPATGLVVEGDSFGYPGNRVAFGRDCPGDGDGAGGPGCGGTKAASIT